jgi:RNA polymerase sigma-70 factor (ECF subfamily)
MEAAGRQGFYPLSWISQQREEQDRQVLSRCREGDTEAFRDVIEAYKNPLYHLIFRWVGHQEGAEELLQDVFLKAFRQIKNFRGESKFSTWIFQIAMNRCRDFHRSARTRKEEALDPDMPLVDSRPKEDELLQSRHEITRVRSAVESLPAIYREALSMRYFAEMSIEEIAKSLGEGLSNVKMRISRGLVKLKSKLEKGVSAP